MPVSKTCKHCNGVFLCRPSHAPIKTYCSKKCMAEDYKVRLQGSANPNFKNENTKICHYVECKKKFNTYLKNKTYCSSQCYHQSRPKKVKPPRKRRIGPKPYIPHPRILKEKRHLNCEECNKAFITGDKRRRFCCYPCAVKNGSSKRAGEASARMKKKYGHKKDANHNELMEALLKGGIPFYDLSAMGFGVPDALIWVNDTWQLLEIKNSKTGYGRRGLNQNQRKWIEQWKGGAVLIITSMEDAVNIIHGRIELIESYPPGRKVMSIKKPVV